MAAEGGTHIHSNNLGANESIMSLRPIPDPARSPAPSGLSVPIERHLTCPICKDLFKEPVTAPCGHSFCRDCLNRNNNCCPCCEQHITRIPEVNVALEGLLQDLHKARLEARSRRATESAGRPTESAGRATESAGRPTESAGRATESAGRATESAGRPGEVACDVCTGPGAAMALKSCLVCLQSYCQAHLEGHRSIGRLRGHRLVEPVENLDDRACQEHGRPLELYCRDSDRCICVLCVEDRQYVVSIEMEWEEKKGQVVNLEGLLQGGIERRNNNLTEMRSTLMVFQDHLRSERIDIDRILSSVISYVENAKRQTILPMTRKSLVVERQAEELTEQLNFEIRVLRSNITDLRRIADIEDPIYFLQTYSPTPDQEEENRITEIALNVSGYFGTFRSIMQNMMDDIHDTLELVTPIELQRIVKFAVDVKLDPSTAHPRLIVSADGKEVQVGGEVQVVPMGPQRFDLCTSVLGRNRLTSGKAYWQVDIGDNVGWDLGVTSVDSQRNGNLVFEPGTKYWVMHCDGEGYVAMTAPPRKLALKAKPEMVGVFLDHEEGLVSFYDLTSSSHIFSFTACSFCGELRPYFSPHNEVDESTARPLVISAV